MSTTVTFTVSSTWTVPTGLTKVSVAAWGAGGTGAPSRLTNGGAGGGGGAYVMTPNVTVVSGNTYTVTGGSTVGGVPGTGTFSGDSWFQSSSTMLAKGGGNGFRFTPGVGGPSSSCIGSVVFAGGSGNLNSGVNGTYGTGGGGGAGTTSVGGNGKTDSVAGGIGGSASGGNGGDGGQSGTSITGFVESIIAGGGGGGISTTSGALGANGQVNITYTLANFLSELSILGAG